jgi:hypothetical protein
VKILMQPAPSPYREVDSEDVVVTSVTRESFTHPGFVAYGYLRSEDKYVYSPFNISIDPRASILSMEIEHGPTYRVAYQDDLGRWTAEGVLRWEPLLESIMKQILLMMARLSGPIPR